MTTGGKEILATALDLSFYTWMETHPWVRTLAAGGALAGTAFLLARGVGKGSEPNQQI
jgi:hypothetical protein